jgi:hypothetical protein
MVNASSVSSFCIVKAMRLRPAMRMRAAGSEPSGVASGKGEFF